MGRVSAFLALLLIWLAGYRGASLVSPFLAFGYS